MSRARKVIGLAVALACGLGVPCALAQRPTDLYTTVNKLDTQTAPQTAKVLWTPASGANIALQGCAVSSGGAQQTTVLIGGTQVLPVIYTAADTPYAVPGYWSPIAVGKIDQTLTYTTTSNTTTTVDCWGFEWGNN